MRHCNLIVGERAHAARFKRDAQAGMLMVDFPTAGLDCHVLFASREVASCGPREQGSYAAGFPTSVKTLYIRP